LQASQFGQSDKTVGRDIEYGQAIKCI
jgi:hypothetical protein